MKPSLEVTEINEDTTLICYYQEIGSNDTLEIVNAKNMFIKKAPIIMERVISDLIYSKLRELGITYKNNRESYESALDSLKIIYNKKIVIDNEIVKHERVCSENNNLIFTCDDIEHTIQVRQRLLFV